MAVSVWIQFQVVLVIAFSRIKIPDWCQFYGQWLGKFFLYGLHYRLNGCGILLICVKDTGSVLAAPVITLPVDTDRINNFKILLRQYAKRNNCLLYTSIANWMLTANEILQTHKGETECT